MKISELYNKNYDRAEIGKFAERLSDAGLQNVLVLLLVTKRICEGICNII